MNKLIKHPPSKPLVRFEGMPPSRAAWFGVAAAACLYLFVRGLPSLRRYIRMLRMS